MCHPDPVQNLIHNLTPQTVAPSTSGPLGPVPVGILTVYDELPSVLERRLRQFWVLCSAGHVLARVAHRRHVLDHRQRHVPVGARLKSMAWNLLVIEVYEW